MSEFADGLSGIAESDIALYGPVREGVDRGEGHSQRILLERRTELLWVYLSVVLTREIICAATPFSWGGS